MDAKTLKRLNESFPLSVTERVDAMVWELWQTSGEPTQTHEVSYDEAIREFQIVSGDIITPISDQLVEL